MNIFNYLDHITLEDALRYAAQGYVFEINDGHVQTMRVPEEGTEDQNDGL